MIWKVYLKRKSTNKTWIKCFESKTRKEAEKFILKHNGTGWSFMLKRWNEACRKHLPVIEVSR